MGGRFRVGGKGGKNASEGVALAAVERRVGEVEVGEVGGMRVGLGTCLLAQVNKQVPRAAYQSLAPSLVLGKNVLRSSVLA